MGRNLLIAVLSIALIDITWADDFKFECPQDVVNSYQPPIVNTTQYSYEVVVTVASKNLSIEAYEVYDISNGTINLYVHYPDKENSSIWISESIHHDFKYNQTFVINRGARTCDVSELDHDAAFSIFGHGIEDGFQNPEFSYRWTGDYNYTKQNSTVFNGIDAEKYSTCLLFNNSQMKYDVDLYFSADGWTTRSGENVPLMVVLQVNRTMDGGQTFQTETYTYTFASFQRDTWVSWSSRASDTPFDIICSGRKDDIPAPPAMSNYASDEEIYLPKSKTILSFRRFYNYKEKLYRADNVPTGNSSGLIPGHHYKIIHDFHEGVEYEIDREVGNCTIRPLKLQASRYMIDFDLESDTNHKGFLRMRNFAKWYSDRNYTYTGRHQHREMTLDSWTSAVPFKFGSGELNETMLFLTPDWSSIGDYSPVPYADSISIRKTKNGTTTTMKYMMKLSHVTTRLQGIHIFDVGTCYNTETSKSFVLKFDSSFGNYIDQYSEVMDAALQAAVAKAANVSKIRVSSWPEKELGLDASSGNKNPKQALFVSVSLYGHPKVHGNITEYTPSQNLTMAVANLKAAVTANKLLVSFKLPTEDVSMTAYPGYFKEKNSLYSPAPVAPEPAPAVAGGLSNGAIAALCIAMLVVGFIIGAVLIHVRYKRGNRQFGYSIQD